MSSSGAVNYGDLFGIESVAAAAIFTVIYAPLAAYYAWRAVKGFNYVFGFMIAFCTVRVVGFIIRAVIAGSDSAASTLGLVIADQILFGMGFSGLLFATYSLQSDRERIAGIQYKQPAMVILTNKRLYHLIIIASVVLVIIGTSNISDSDPDKQSLGKTLRTAGTWVLFGATAIQGFRSGAFVYLKSTKYRRTGLKTNTFVDTHAATLLALISALLVERMIYTVITLGQRAHEATYYPLSALPEFLCVCLVAIPGLVLSRTELQEQDVLMQGYRANDPERLYAQGPTIA
ncbi:hypothetical protein D9756_008796 [Leucocoprinus leucothites]|uniref:DUF7702 domain-containing protein n=1 Tax=Leucocoprinus leucothites TaxID=201217 RepID=A0A8H5CY01_9AGAR|nr:hypothetical protein D9756_008796 [Leucoagaricus leucothites]